MIRTCQHNYCFLQVLSMCNYNDEMSNSYRQVQSMFNYDYEMYPSPYTLRCRRDVKLHETTLQQETIDCSKLQYPQKISDNQPEIGYHIRGVYSRPRPALIVLWKLTARRPRQWVSCVRLTARRPSPGYKPCVKLTATRSSRGHKPCVKLTARRPSHRV